MTALSDPPTTFSAFSFYDSRGFCGVLMSCGEHQAGKATPVELELELIQTY